MGIYHILNGDCLATQFRDLTLQDEVIVCRECLVEGKTKAENLTDFWNTRAAFIAATYNVQPSTYFSNTVKEFEKLYQLTSASEVCLWFENDLFCQVNMWFVLSLLATLPVRNVYRVFPVAQPGADRWRGFSDYSPNLLLQAYQARVQLSPEDMALGQNLWTAYQQHDLEQLKALSHTPSDCFQYLEEVCQAHSDRFPEDSNLDRPERVIKEILNTTATDFPTVFAEFSAREGIYGFSDLQVKTIYNRLLGQA
ncbi:DUF1835 domain-containing protein [Pontibacter sp. E15-1]|uniref:DUF1835 domain-containing protein n=1 Tax=Pontibacter sp. E15-1 TaxID=2919918 RepID=UPI001F4FB640|nr:DUF1835 domain-containing protein [Pontibacter sp. E15-1]MCJ8165213.1 DUF1835 domain-containing protein [Pontibacter sp. E15-1]